MKTTGLRLILRILSYIVVSQAEIKIGVNYTGTDFEICKPSEICINIRNCSPSNLETNSTTIVEILRQPCGRDSDIDETPKICCKQSTLAPPTYAPANYPSLMLENSQEDFSECGKTKKTDFRVHGGTNSSLGDWPWMAALGYSLFTEKPIQFHCGGSLISKQWILTAAHCIRDTNGWKFQLVRLGDLNLGDGIDDGAKPVDILVDKIHLHPAYTRYPLKNDIALLHLEKPIEFTEHIRPICLPSGDRYKQNEYYERKQPIALGWGAVGWFGKRPYVLQEAKVGVVSESKCVELYQTMKGIKIDEKIICAEEQGKGTCQGDSGGPLMFPNSTEGRFYLGGLVSAGFGCGNEYPGIYMKVAYYINWINEVTGEKF